MIQHDLTEKFQALEVPFALDEHDWLQGNPYIKKDAIRRRLNSVDPRWSLSEPQLVAVQGDIVVMSSALTVLGSIRSNIGTGLIQHAAPDKDGVVSAYNEGKLLAKAYKAAASDLLPRCAQQFNVGWYLLNMSKGTKKLVETPAGLKRYLDSLAAAPHWAKNGGGERFNARMKALNLQSAYVLANLEPDEVLRKLSDTTLTEQQALARLDALAQKVQGNGE